jgi:hypothetical protein
LTASRRVEAAATGAAEKRIEKLHLHSRMEAVVYAAREKLLEIK